MNARLYELIRDYQSPRSAAAGGYVPEFRLEQLRLFAVARPDRYPEYALDDGRLAADVRDARRSGEVTPPYHGGRDDYLRLRHDPGAVPPPDGGRDSGLDAYLGEAPG